MGATSIHGDGTMVNDGFGKKDKSKRTGSLMQRRLWTDRAESSQTEELWLDPERGMFCRGPPGPKPSLDWGYLDSIDEDLPLTAELLQEDVLLRFLASLKSKRVNCVIVKGVVFSGALTDVRERVLGPTVISALTNAPIAIAHISWSSLHGLSDRKLLGDGMTR
ncbi:hypothetical protein PQX77_020667 [Marasmius sp. AFHP31]|nr:hypothetical protein PQX77_020667 [Marasmius sp. AFHP31]